jgi:hypothetical protein
MLQKLILNKAGKTDFLSVIRQFGHGPGGHSVDLLPVGADIPLQRAAEIQAPCEMADDKQENQ